jgi:hypothetical protein
MMCDMWGKAVTILAGALILFGLGTASGASAADKIVSETTCCTFAGGPIFQNLGENPLYENPAEADAWHNVTSVAAGPDGASLFASETIAPGATSVVDGTQYLSAGAYPFYCTLHGQSMAGVLTVRGEMGQVVPRPAISVAIPSQRLKAVRRTGKVKVKLTASPQGGSVILRVNRGKQLIAFRPGVVLTGGATKTVSVALSKAGRKAMRSGRAVKLQVRATVRFGSPRSASRTLR